MRFRWGSGGCLFEAKITFEAIALIKRRGRSKKIRGYEQGLRNHMLDAHVMDDKEKKYKGTREEARVWLRKRFYEV